MLIYLYYRQCNNTKLVEHLLNLILISQLVKYTYYEFYRLVHVMFNNYCISQYTTVGVLIVYNPCFLVSGCEWDSLCYKWVCENKPGLKKLRI